MATGLAIILGLIALLYVLYPLLRHLQMNEQNAMMISASHESDVISSPDENEQSARIAIKDIELDYHLGNIEKHDYLVLREKHMQRALVALKLRSEHEQKIDQEIEEQVRRMRDNYEQTNS
jgi:hypothetical protein